MVQILYSVLKKLILNFPSNCKIIYFRIILEKLKPFLNLKTIKYKGKILKIEDK
jgi:hypothetical protein